MQIVVFAGFFIHPVYVYKENIINKRCNLVTIQGVQNNAIKWKFNRLSCIINVVKQFNFYIRRKNSYNHNDEKWPLYRRQMKIADRNNILPLLGIAWKTKHILQGE
jgi:hypothetical protein